MSLRSYSMHQHVDADLLLLEAHAALGIGGDESVVVGTGQLARLVQRARLAHLVGLREGSNRDGRIRRQVGGRLLHAAALDESSLRVGMSNEGTAQRDAFRSGSQVPHQRPSPPRGNRFHARTPHVLRPRPGHTIAASRARAAPASGSRSKRKTGVGLPARAGIRACGHGAGASFRVIYCLPFPGRAMEAPANAVGRDVSRYRCGAAPDGHADMASPDSR
jgi:hypothetical protein